MLSWTQQQAKFVRLSRDNTSGTLVQGKEDMNTAYHMFNAKFGRYFSRKQQFTNLNIGQGIYQNPIDCIKIIGMVVRISDTYQIPIKEIRDEYEWRQITAYPYSSNWPAYYFSIGNDEFELWPTPSQFVANGIRYYYQPQSFDLSVEDITSTSTSTTISITNGDVTVTSSGSDFTPQMQGLWFQVNGVTDLTWYEIVGVPDSSHLTLKSAFVGITGTGLGFTVGQLSILPEEYQDVPIHYALNLFFSGKGNESRATQHFTMFNNGINDAIESYSASTQGNIVSEGDNYINSWFVTPLPPPGV